MDVFVIGGSGLVGGNIVEYCRENKYPVEATYHSVQTDETTVKLNKQNHQKVREVLERHDPDIVVDTAAFHAVDKCETARERAWEVNAAGTAAAAQAADHIGAHFVYISTDYVFGDTVGDAPYAETDPVAPANYYAQTKYAGEQAAKVPDTWTILRSSVIYGLASDNFLTWVLGELRKSNRVGIVDDQVSTPTYAPDVARACVDVAERGLTGLYHAAGPISLSRYQFTMSLAEVGGYDTGLISAITSEELGQEAPRPRDSSLDSTHLYDAIDHRFQQPETSFREIIRRS